MRRKVKTGEKEKEETNRGDNKTRDEGQRKVERR